MIPTRILPRLLWRGVLAWDFTCLLALLAGEAWAGSIGPAAYPAGQVGEGQPCQAGAQPLAADVAFTGETAFLVENGSGCLRILDLSDPAHPRETGSIQAPSGASAVAVVGNLLYLAAGESGLRVLDASDPANPTEISAFDLPGYASDLAISGERAYVACVDGGLWILDISEPEAPKRAGSFTGTGSAYGASVSGGHAFLAAGEAGLLVVDVSEPAEPRLAGSHDLPGNAWRLDVAGDLAYLAAQEGGLRIVDVSDPARPRESGSFSPPGRVLDVAVHGDRAYLAADQAGLRILDVSDPAHPVETGTFDTPGSAAGLAIREPVAAIADWESGLRIVDISDPARPVEIGFFTTPQPGEGEAPGPGVPLVLWILAAVLAALSLHWLAWVARLNYPALAAALGGASALAFLLASGFFLFIMNPRPPSGADAAYVIGYLFLILWAIVIVFAVLGGTLQARAMEAMWWMGVLGVFFEAGLAFLFLTGVNYSIQFYGPQMEDIFQQTVGVLLERFFMAFLLSLGALAVLGPAVRLSRLRRSDGTNSS